jgi:hypothetical protein
MPACGGTSQGEAIEASLTAASQGLGEPRAAQRRAGGNLGPGCEPQGGPPPMSPQGPYSLRSSVQGE